MKPFLLLLAALPLAAQTLPEALAFLERAEKELLAASNYANRAGWLQSTYINEDSETQAALANEQYIRKVIALSREANRFDRLALPAEAARKMKLLKLNLTMVTPSNDAESTELTRLVARMESTYGSGKYCRDAAADKGKCLDLVQISNIMATSRDPKELADLWQGWHRAGPPMRKDYTRFVELANKGARELGFPDSGAMWRSKYDMPPDAFAKEVDRLWEQVKPLYVSLHAYVRRKLRDKYGADVVPARGPIPAHLLGNMWGQSWENIYDILAPANAAKAYDLTKILKDRKVDELEMVRYGERFFSSLGFAPLPKTFWQRSLFVKPGDREVVCHASAWDVDNDEDLRIKMCIQISEEEFGVIHHELGHNYYQRAYKSKPYLFRDSANDGFHEAVGDTIALSITPEYLTQIGLLDKATDPSGDIGLLMKQALAKIAFLPFGLISTSGAGRSSPARSPRPSTTRSGGSCAASTRASTAGRGARSFSIPSASITSRPTCPIRATSSPTFCSSSSTARSRRPPAAADRSTAAPSTTRKRPAPSSTPCSKWAPASLGRRLWPPSAASAKWTRPPWWTTSLRSRSGSTNRTRASPPVGSRAAHGR